MKQKSASAITGRWSEVDSTFIKQSNFKTANFCHKKITIIRSTKLLTNFIYLLQ